MVETRKQDEEFANLKVRKALLRRIKRRSVEEGCKMYELAEEAFQAYERQAGDLTNAESESKLPSKIVGEENPHRDLRGTGAESTLQADDSDDAELVRAQFLLNFIRPVQPFWDAIMHNIHAFASSARLVVKQERLDEGHTEDYWISREKPFEQLQREVEKFIADAKTAYADDQRLLGDIEQGVERIEQGQHPNRRRIGSR